MAFAATALMRGWGGEGHMHARVRVSAFLHTVCVAYVLRVHFARLCECTTPHRSSEPHSLKSAGSNGKRTAGGRAPGWGEGGEV